MDIQLALSSFEMGYKFCEQGLNYNQAEIKFKGVVALLYNRAADTKVEEISSPNTGSPKSICDGCQNKQCTMPEKVCYKIVVSSCSGHE